MVKLAIPAQQQDVRFSARCRRLGFRLAPICFGVMLAGMPSWAGEAGDKNAGEPLKGALGDYVDKSWKGYANNLYGGALELANTADRAETIKQIKFYRNWLGRASGAIKIANAAASGDVTDTAVQALAAITQEYFRQNAGKDLLKAAGVSSMLPALAITATMTTYESYKALAKEKRGVELESLYGGLEGDHVLNPGFRAGRSLGEGDPIPVTRDAVEHVFRRLMADQGFRERFRTYVTQELQQPFPEPGYWGQLETWFGSGSQETAAQSALLEQRQQVDQWIAGLLSTLNRRLKAQEAAVKAQKDAEKLIEQAIQALDKMLEQFNTATARFDSKMEAAREAQKPKPKEKPPEVRPSGPTEPQRIASATAQARSFWSRSQEDFRNTLKDYRAEVDKIHEQINTVTPVTPPKVRVIAWSEDKLRGGGREDMWGGWDALPVTPDDPLMTRYSNTTTKVLRARIGEYDRAIGELDQRIRTLESIGREAERVLGIYQPVLTDIKANSNALYQAYAPYIELDPPWHDPQTEGYIASNQMKYVSAEYLATRNQSLAEWHKAEARIDRKARLVDSLEDVFGELNAIVVATPSVVETYRQLRDSAEASKQAYVTGLDNRERAMKAGVARYRTLEANFINSFSQIIGATRGLYRVQSGEFWSPRRNNQIDAPRLDEKAIAAKLAGIADPAAREAKTAELLEQFRQAAAEEDHLLHLLLVGQNFAVEDAAALEQHLDSWTQGLNHVVNYGGEPRQDFKEVAGVELKDIYYDIIQDLSNGDFTFWRIGGAGGERWMRSAKAARSNLREVITALETGTTGLSPQAKALKNMAKQVKDSQARWIAAGDEAWAVERARLFKELESYQAAASYHPDINQAIWDVHAAMSPIISHYIQLAAARAEVEKKAAAQIQASKAAAEQSQAVIVVKGMYDRFRDAYQRRDARAVTRFMHTSWRAADGTTLDDVEETLANSFRVFDQVTVTISGLQVKPGNGGLFTASYHIQVVGEMTRKGIRHEEGGDVIDTVEVKDGMPLILNTQGARWVLGGE